MSTVTLPLELVERLTKWRLFMSYNDSYFGEPEGELKRLTEEIERAAQPVAPTQSGEPVGYITARDLRFLKEGRSRWAKAFTAVEGIPRDGEPIYATPQSAGTAQSAVVLDAARAAQQIQGAFNAFADRYDHDSNEWLDMDVQKFFEAGYKARAASTQVTATPTTQIDEQITKAAYEQFGIVAEDAEIEAFARYVRGLPAQTGLGLTNAPQFDAKHVSLKERTDGKLVLTLLLDGVEGAPHYKVTPVNPGVVRGAVQSADGGDRG